MRWRRSSLTLALLTTLLAAVWLVALPRLSATDAMAGKIEAAERAGIEPGAVFWTEHAMERSLR